jgi:hypothetical protein
VEKIDEMVQKKLSPVAIKSTCLSLEKEMEFVLSRYTIHSFFNGEDGE